MESEERPTWAVILEYIYEGEEEELNVSVKNTGDVKVRRSADIITESESEVGDVRSAISYMLQAGLVERNFGGNSVSITPKGFQVAHERKIQEQEEHQENLRIKSQNDINRIIGFLTFGLLFLTWSDSAVYGVLNMKFPPELALFIIGSSLFLLIGLLIVIYRTALVWPQIPSE